ncbi:MAG TPA: tripartite tricarboxylate transporter TctB family protein [Candidatus Binatia bacterium]
MRAAEYITAFVLMALGGIVLVDAVRLGIGWGTDGPRSGFFPFWLALIMIVTCAVILWQTFRHGSREVFVTREQLGPVLKVILPAAAMVLLTHFLGLYVAAALYTGSYMRWVGRHSWMSVVAVALAISVISFVIFELWFLVPMPKGPVESWLGY